MGNAESTSPPLRIEGVSTRLPKKGGAASAQTCCSKGLLGANDIGVRVCVFAGRGAERCAVARRGAMRQACGDACFTACEAAVKDVNGWWRRRRARQECSSTCRPSCDQPPRVSRSEFQLYVN